MPGTKIDKSRLINVFGGSSLRIKYKDVFSIDELYIAMMEWLREYGWKDYYEDSDELWETFYSEKVGSGGAKNITIWWRLQRKPNNAEQIHYYLDVDFMSFAVVPTEVIKDGHKISTFKGELEITINGFVDKKYLDTLDKNSLLKTMKEFFVRDVYDPGPFVKELYQELYAFQNFIKQWFKMKRYLPYQETKGFFPSHSWPTHQK
ncbi:MAG: hypothetical protein Q8Q01_03475 [archaeon]|nr:hypothetical protein [archaeon]